jgi:hypothetical protein
MPEQLRLAIRCPKAALEAAAFTEKKKNKKFSVFFLSFLP